MWIRRVSYTNVFKYTSNLFNTLSYRQKPLHTAATAISSSAMSDHNVPVDPKHKSCEMFNTQILPVDASKLGDVENSTGSLLNDLRIKLDEASQDVQHIRLAAKELQMSNVPVAFPTETVYGLGADATRSDAVRGIYKAKQRPSDNPLIVHFSSLRQLNALLSAGEQTTERVSTDGHEEDVVMSHIPHIYHPLIERFWPGPLTIILPNPANSPLAPEVTAGLSTFGARIPRNILALLLISLSNRPIAAPSANASTKPSPTAAEHVKEDLDGRIRYIIDGGPCDVGVESTVVDGLSNPPAVLRPGGISIDQLRECPGWEEVVIAYENVSLKKGAPRAPGMKYRHYSPRAKVFLYEAGSARPDVDKFEREGYQNVGFVRTRRWKRRTGGMQNGETQHDIANTNGAQTNGHQQTSSLTSPVLNTLLPVQRPAVRQQISHSNPMQVSYWEIDLGDRPSDVARDLFWALRELDRRGCDLICIEGISPEEGDVADAVMNRLRKAAEIEVKG